MIQSFSKLLNSKLIYPILIFLLAILIRSIKIQDHLFFGFEQGRDLLVIKKIYEFTDFVLVGPSTSIGGLFHGSWYYYLLAIPLGATSGNPLAASIFLLVLGSLFPVVIYFLAKRIIGSNYWGVFAGIVAVFSHEYILYSRWLSNVSPAPLFIALSFLMLWEYIKKSNEKYFLLFVIFSAFASSFQMILIVQLLFLLFLVMIFKLIKPPSLKLLFFSVIILLIIFSPAIIFDLRNQNITSRSLINYVFDSENTHSSSGQFNSLTTYLLQLKIRFYSVLANTNIQPLQILLFASITMPLLITYKNYKSEILFMCSIILMSLPIIVISPGNPQYYVAIGIGWILLLVWSVRAFWLSKKLKIIAILITGIFTWGMILTLNNLQQNKDVFFRTIQDDLNYKDQKALLKFIHDDAASNPYKLVSFTIPSLQPEAWDYLRQYFYPADEQGGAKIIYIVIEKHVYPVWEKKWINDLGETDLLFEKKFGQLRLQKRKVLE